MGAGDVRVEGVPDPKIEEPTDAVIRISRACICGSDLWPYASLDPSDGVLTSVIPIGDEHPDTPTSVCNLASTYRNQGRWKDAEELGV